MERWENAVRVSHVVEVDDGRAEKLPAPSSQR